ncbi:hypothetical protein SOVF_203340 [Spinacia oleracea]|uniref:Uncharacterized protein n=1 Tax=Spinacia oleracea TaxID=3562 RepID=A0A9R0J046_SPIOL|nr:uncharacterized protein LOC110797978 [Spinacia oleracea]KNA04043.1 hypothetical protein SOVF_203340 [Spinacia oleracea]
MVKAIPRISERKTRKRRRFPVKSDNLLLGIKMANLTTIPPSSNHLHLLQQTSTPKSDPQILDLIHATPPPLKRKRNSCCPTSSPSYSSSTYATCSSSPAISPSLSSPSPPPPSAFLLRCNSSASSSENSSSAEKMRKIFQELNASPSPVPRNLMARLLPPLPPPPSPKLLRRTVSDPVTLSPGYSTLKGNNEKEKRQEQLVKAEKLSGDWTMFKLKCECGSDFQFLFCGADGKCYKLV